jgi:cis-L-3-hydroxyproline dehydratase
MKIVRISAYQVDLPRERTYRLSGGRVSSSFDTTVVRMESDTGLVGLGEVCPFGSAYLPAYAAGVRTGIAEVAPHLIGEDPRQVECTNQTMDMALKGHPYVKSALDIACWDLLGQAADMALSTLLGGRFGDDAELYQTIPHDTPDAMRAGLVEARAEGYRRFQPKVGGEPDTDIERICALAAERQTGEVVVVDANGGWLAHEAMRVVGAIRDLDITIEQPCASYEACLAVRRHTDLPLVLDEVIDSVPALLRAHADGAMDAINLKLSKVGGMTRARQIRDLCVALGLPMTIEDSGGGDIIGTAVAHLAQATPEKYRFGVSSGFFKVKLNTTEGAPRIAHGRISAPTGPGLGLRLRTEALGEPVVDVT